jgi:ribosome biogenesis GTPase A
MVVLVNKADLHYSKQNKSWKETEKENCGKIDGQSM